MFPMAGFRQLLIFALFPVACGGEQTQPVQPDQGGGSDEIVQVTMGRAAGLVLACSGCHGGQTDGIPPIEGLSEQALLQALLSYRDDREGGSVMHAMMRGYSQADIEAIAAYLAAHSTP